jgi:hypothetical protein
LQSRAIVEYMTGAFIEQSAAGVIQGGIVYGTRGSYLIFEVKITHYFLLESNSIIVGG